MNKSGDSSSCRVKPARVIATWQAGDAGSCSEKQEGNRPKESCFCARAQMEVINHRFTRRQSRLVVGGSAGSQSICWWAWPLRPERSSAWLDHVGLKRDLGSGCSFSVRGLEMNSFNEYLIYPFQSVRSSVLTDLVLLFFLFWSDNLDPLNWGSVKRLQTIVSYLLRMALWMTPVSF